MDLYGLDWTIEGSASDTETMGPQYPATLLEHLKEIRDTDGGFVYDSPDSLAVTFRTRVDLYSQTPAIELTPPGPAVTRQTPGLPVSRP